ncbi:MAG TPA: hypothetical protein VK045_11220 [Ornithinicoccus sp.]|nr:hypothetical protein [Ornithinicoccus sp.]
MHSNVAPSIPSGWLWVAGGALCGLAWSAALRGYMVELAGAKSAFTWSGTFGALLAPGAVTGALLGWAEHLRRTGPPTGWRWLALAPLTLALAPMLLPGAASALLTTGVGGGALAVVGMGMVGGYALSGRGPRSARLASGALSAAFACALAASVPAITSPPLSLTDPRGVWVAVLAVSLFGAFAIGCSLPHRPASRTKDAVTTLAAGDTL